MMLNNWKACSAAGSREEGRGPRDHSTPLTKVGEDPSGHHQSTTERKKLEQWALTPISSLPAGSTPFSPTECTERT